ncbi:tyrosine-type recombinase/integrase [Bradyrhizobium ottawaense]|uniref:tyrosine-type recombinase/integrase n=1 Tax=Bradyrhizobium ottawaense TaxID=931866 RepID=UPI0030F3A3F6
MGTIIARKRKDGTTGFTAQVLKKQAGKIVWREAKTFDRRQAATAWMKKRETELAEPGGLERARAPKGKTLADAIDKYTETSRKEIGRTKAQVLAAIKDYDIANMDCAAIRSEDIVSFAEELSKGRQPSTVGNYISHLAAIFAVAKPAWGIPLDRQAIQDAQTVLSRLEVTSKSKQRDRRPTLAELDRLMQHFVDRQARAPRSAPMHRIVPFAIFSTRRQEEITTIKWEDFEPDHKRILVRDMKHPGQKVGNDVWVELPDEAIAVIKAMPRTVLPEIFPYTTDAIGAAFTRACLFLGINTDDMPDEKRLHFHDLRHDGVSRQFEMGKTIPQAASVSGHKSWHSLKRYTHLRQTGDKYAGWKWLKVVTTKTRAKPST